MSNNPNLQQARDYFANLGAEAAAIWQVAEENNPGLSYDDLLPIVREMYVRQHMPALFRVGVEFTDEQKAMIRQLIEQGETVKAQKIILDELGKRENE